MVDKVKKRRITQKDWESAQEFVKNELKRRKDNTWRQNHEKQWKEVDRQVQMEADNAKYYDANPQDWHNRIELGELSKASEVLSADFRRLVFPNNRSWFESHAELKEDDEDAKAQKSVDGHVRAIMAQQHRDFNLKDRVDLSVKEALHHGSFVAEIMEVEAAKIHQDSGVETVKSPAWQPHSMWNCYPDHSQAIIGMDLFYRGSMIIKWFKPLPQVIDMMKGPGWMSSQIKNIPTRKTKQSKDIELLTYYGDIEFRRNDGLIVLPNTKTILANGIIIFHKENKTPYLPLIYGGYERLDIRDPYYTSPLIKQSPMQKVGSAAANSFLDATDLNAAPPMSYDKNDFPGEEPEYAPNAKWPTQRPDSVKFADTPDPTHPFNGMQFAIQQVETGTSVNSARAGGKTDRAEKTAFEVRKEAQGAEIRTIDFIDKFEDKLRAFLYMQHDLNKAGLNNYTYFNPEMDSPDFNRASKNDLPKNVHFEVVGSKGLLGEEERAERTTMVTSFASENELFSGLLNPIEILKSMYMDAGQKNPEIFLNMPDDPENQIREQMQQQFQEIIDEAQAELQELQKSNLEKDIKLEKVGVTVTGLQQQIKIMEEQNQLTTTESRIDEKIKGLKDAERLFEIKRQFELDLDGARNEPPPGFEPEESNEQIEELQKQIAELASKIGEEKKEAPVLVIDNSGSKKKIIVKRTANGLEGEMTEES